MRTLVVKEHFGNYSYPSGDTRSLETKISDAVEEFGEPTEIQFSTAQTTANGGQFGHWAVLLIWREEDA